MAWVEARGSCSPLSAVTKPFLFPPLAFPSFEAHKVQIFSPLPVHVAVIYRPPTSTHPPSAFLSHFESWHSFSQTPLIFSLGTSTATLMTALSLGLPAFSNHLFWPLTVDCNQHPQGWPLPRPGFH
ncbi:hypothetical protein FKM82_018032 [Ascaphus truei]